MVSLNGTFDHGNTTSNLSDGNLAKHFHSQVSPSWRAAIGSLYVLVFIVGVIGNSLVVYTFGWKRRHKQLTNEFLLMCLGVCDLLSSVIFPVLFVIYIFTIHSTASYITGCLLHPPLLVASVSISQVILVLICYDRYRAITKPLARKMCIKCAKYGTLIGFIVSMILCIPMFLHLDIDNEQTYVCFGWEDSASALMSQSSLLLVRDLTALITMVWFIKKMLRTLSCSEWFRKNSNSAAVSDFNRTRKLLLAVVTLFTIFIFPTDIYWAFIAFKYRNAASSQVNWDAIALQMAGLVLIQVLNSVANVFVYSAVHREFKIVLREILGKIRDRTRSIFAGSGTSTELNSIQDSAEVITNRSALGKDSPMVSGSVLQLDAKTRPYVH